MPLQKKPRPHKLDFWGEFSNTVTTKKLVQVGLEAKECVRYPLDSFAHFHIQFIRMEGNGRHELPYFHKYLLPFGDRISKFSVFSNLRQSLHSSPGDPSYCFVSLSTAVLLWLRSSNGHEKRQTISSNLVALPPCHTPAIEIITHFSL